MKIFLFIFFSVFSSNRIFASQDCDHLEFLITKINLHTYNLSNTDTTRTAEGGPFKRQEFTNCKHWTCEIVSTNKIKLVYNPEHPDSNNEGYVQMPDVNPVDEMAHIINATRDYEKVIAIAPQKSSECRHLPTFIDL